MSSPAKQLVGHETLSILPDIVRGLPSNDQRKADCGVIAHAVLGKSHYSIAESDARRYGYARDGNGMLFSELIKMLKDHYVTGRLTWYEGKRRSLATYIREGATLTGIVIIKNDQSDMRHVVPVLDGIVLNASEDHWSDTIVAVLKINFKRTRK